MDTTDSRIAFDRLGVCDHCQDFERNIERRWKADLRDGMATLAELVKRIKQSSKGNEFDCLLGISGGVDSSYMLHLAVVQFGLRPLVFHVDGGWNSELAVHNIETMVEKLGVDLYTEVIDWNEMRDFQLAFFKAGVPHIDIPQDHAFVGTLYRFADKHDVRFILNGGNISTECVRNPMEWLYYGTDMSQIRDIRRRFGTVEMKSYPFSSVWRHKVYLRYVKGLRVFRPLNYMPYVKADAQSLLESTYGWRPYPQKHFESRFTRFYEGIWLPRRFGFDTRRVQFSSLILTNQMTREDALERLAQPAVDTAIVDQEMDYVASKLGISRAELDHYLTMPKKFYWDYRNQEYLFRMGARMLKAFGAEAAVKR